MKFELKGYLDRAKEYKKKINQRIKERKERPKVKKELENDFLVYLFFRSKDIQEYKDRRVKFAKEAVPHLLEGCGGVKNIISVHSYALSIKITFKSHYQIKEEILRKAGGLHLWIGDHELIEVFDRLEVKHIISGLKQELKKSKNSLIKLDIA